jgi:hypothetical protein
MSHYEDFENAYYAGLDRLQSGLVASAKGMTDEEAAAHPIRPLTIDLSRNPHLLDTFGEAFVEAGAVAIVKFMQVEDQWREFTLQEVKATNHEIRTLIQYGWIVELNGRFRLSPKFPERCLEGSRK